MYHHQASRCGARTSLVDGVKPVLSTRAIQSGIQAPALEELEVFLLGCVCQAGLTKTTMLATSALLVPLVAPLKVGHEPLRFVHRHIEVLEQLPG